ncbi:hypothetical protein ACV3V0_15140 [Clostridium perfringens]
MWFLLTKNKECLKFTVMYLLNLVSKSDVMEKIINIVKSFLTRIDIRDIIILVSTCRLMS